MTMLDRRGPEPLWVQLRDRLRAEIVDRSLSPGAQIPTEEELRKLHGVSRSVVRQALASLENDGLIDRRPGRGSVVTTPLQHHRQAELAGGLREHLGSFGQSLRTELRAFDLVPAQGEAATKLQTERAWQIHRVRFIDDEPAISMQTWVSYDRFPGLSAALLGTGSLLETLAMLGARPVGGPRRFQAVPAPEEVAKDLGIARNTPVILMSGVTADADAGVLESFRAWHQPEMVFTTDARVRMSAANGRSLLG
jgi:GntR family transcriptional regulator